jgi:KAP family P-loop domain
VTKFVADFTNISDAEIRYPTSDLLKFHRYVNPLISILTNPEADTPFTIGIFGAWGSGKTSLMRLLDSELESNHKDKFIRVWFNPWMHRSEPNLLVPLLHALHDTLNEDGTKRFLESAQKIGTVLAKLGLDILLKKLTADAVSLEKLDKLEKDYFDARHQVESAIRKLHETLQKQADTIKGSGAKIIVFVDDLDRCEPGQIIDLLEAVKLFFDLKYVFVILAVDKEVIDRGIEIKYSKFKFAESRAAAIGAEYLEKMVQLPLQLFPLHREQVHKFIETFDPPEVVKQQLALFKDLLDPSPRKIKRILNLLAVTATIAKATPGLEKLQPGILARLTVLQVQSGDLFSEAVKQPDLLLALEATYSGDLALHKQEDWLARYGQLSEAFLKFCQQYYRPTTYLAKLFKDRPFKAVGPDLPTYFAMFGGSA